MRIGVCLIGVSHSKGEKGRDWKTCAIRMKEVFSNVDYYITTYDYDIKLERFYKPKKYQTLKYKNSTQRGTYIKALESIDDVDFIITTRFDAYIHYMRSEMNIDYEKFNFLCKEKGTWDTYRFVNDNFFAFPIHMKKMFIDAIKALDSDPLKKNFMHHIYKYITPFTDTHFILDGEHSSKENEFYNLIRICSSHSE
jgi:hypothetical protein